VNKDLTMSYQAFGELMAQRELVNMVLVTEEGDIEFTDIYYFSDTPDELYKLDELSNLDVKLQKIPNEK